MTDENMISYDTCSTTRYIFSFQIINSPFFHLDFEKSIDFDILSSGYNVIWLYIWQMKTWYHTYSTTRYIVSFQIINSPFFHLDFEKSIDIWVVATMHLLIFSKSIATKGVF